MRIVAQNTKKFISVLGLPRGGTTIVCNIFNSMDNAFCLSEPHWTLISNPKGLRLDKSKGISLNNHAKVIDEINKKLKSDKNLDFAGLKETYRPKESRMKKYLTRMAEESDIVAFVFRHPKAHYNSFKVMAKQHKRNPMPIKFMVDSFNSMYDVMLNTKKRGNGFYVVLEDLCAASNKGAIKYINNQSQGLLQIEGQFKINPTTYIYGNHQANRSKGLAKANMNMNLLTPEDIKTLNVDLMPKYRQLRRA